MDINTKEKFILLITEGLEVDQSKYIIKFETVSKAEANRYASELRDMLLDATPDLRVDQRRDDTRTQDFGATLVVVLGTPSVLAAIKAIDNWLKLRNSASLTIEKDGQIIAQNLTSKDAAKLAELFLTKK
jgi:hypothetical protein